ASLDLVVICASIRISFLRKFRWNQLSKRTTPTKLSLFHSTLNSEVTGSEVTGTVAVVLADDHGLEIEAAQHPIGDLRVRAALTAGAQHLGAGGLHRPLLHRDHQLPVSLNEAACSELTWSSVVPASWSWRLLNRVRSGSTTSS